MALFKWNDTFSVKVAAIDDQHKRLVALNNEFHFAIVQGRGDTILDRILKDLLDYADVHFRAEEALMRAHSYPESHQHVGAHEEFRANVREFGKVQASGSLCVHEDVSRFLSDWLAQHINGVDKRLGAFLNEKGVT